MIPNGLLISAPASGTGKTTLMLGLARALSRKGLQVQPFKSGPDYIDPAFHTAATGRSGINMDSWAMPQSLLDNLLHRAEGADLILAEGSMGLFDGVASAGEVGNGASADIATSMGWPVVLVIDVSGQAQSAAATAKGFSELRPEMPFAGVVLNRVASPRHEMLSRVGMEQTGIKVLGALPRNPDITLPERHLGLVQAQEKGDLHDVLEAMADFVEKHVDVEMMLKMAGAQDHYRAPNKEATVQPPGQRIALAQDAAFSFVYPHVADQWRVAGSEILPFSPLADEAPDPTADICWLPGGYPELHAGALAAANHFKTSLVSFAADRPVHGECGGYMAMGDVLIDKDGVGHQMAGLLGLETSYAKRKMHLGYRHASLTKPMPGYKPGARLRGHEFHYSTILKQPDQPLADVKDANDQAIPETGSVRGNATGTFFHLISEGRKGN
ncbi:cobyrinate a,c-diamide synthase [Sneathiella aquimaris]|uniref:cobyrinate a,c-diamide synthase n=1 Tax=Sneathiella aquimaris TaxID=2599305 RepID=UPI00146A64CB|nr:cobyrinate a,c-diamide synthase [Sneathiella aquimaris]